LRLELSRLSGDLRDNPNIPPVGISPKRILRAAPSNGREELRVILAAGIICLSFLSMAAEAAQECRSIGLTRFALGPGVGSRARVARQTPHGRFVVRAERTGYSSAKMRFSLDGRRMVSTSLKHAPPDIKACLSEKAREMSHKKKAQKFYCEVMDEPRCENGECFALACCYVGSERVCATGTAAY
jgi:hypothetical protein